MSEHTYPSDYQPNMGSADIDTAWEILDTIKPGVISSEVRFFLAGQIVGHLMRVRREVSNCDRA